MSLRESGNGLRVPGHGKQINQRQGLEPIPMGRELPRVPGKSRRVAGDIDDDLRASCGDPADHVGASTGPRWVQQHNVIGLSVRSKPVCDVVAVKVNVLEVGQRRCPVIDGLN